MKKRNTSYIINVSKWILAIVLTVFNNWTSLADEIAPGDFGGGDNPLDTSSSTTSAPIDNYVCILILFGIGFAFYKSKLLTKMTP